MVNYRTYRDSDFEQVLLLLNNNKKFDHLSKNLLHEKLYQDPGWDVETTLVAEDNGNIIGFLQGVTRMIRDEKYGYIKLIAVDESRHREGIGSKLYNKLEALFKASGFYRIRIYDVPLNYFMPGVDPRYTPAVCFALKHGFKHTGDACNMQVDLLSKNWELQEDIDKLKKQHIEICRAEERDKEELFNFISQEWALWQNELEMAFKTDPVSIFVARLNGEIKAFSAYNGNNVGTGWFGPMGTHADLRGKGMGSVLLYLCLNDLKAAGFTKATIPWVAPIGFYSHYANAEIDRVFWRFEKIIEHE